jgi:hypothetical protein
MMNEAVPEGIVQAHVSGDKERVERGKIENA